MSTRMADTDWSVALEVFRTSPPRRGDERRDDRLVLEALHFFASSQRHVADAVGAVRQVEQCLEARRPAEQGGRVRNLRRSHRLAVVFGPLVEMFDRPSCVPMFRRLAPKEAGSSGARPFPRRLLHQDPPEDRFRRPSDRLRPDRRRKGRCAAFPDPARAWPRCRSACAGADKGYASKTNRQAARSRAIIPVIAHKANEKNKPAFFAKALYRGRPRIGQAFGRLGCFKRVAYAARRPSETSQPSSLSPPHSSSPNPPLRPEDARCPQPPMALYPHGAGSVDIARGANIADPPRRRRRAARRPSASRRCTGCRLSRYGQRQRI